MPKKQQIFGDLSDPRGIAGRLLAYLDWMRERGCSSWTLEECENQLGYFSRWCEERGMMRPGEISQALLERYQGQVNHGVRLKDGKPLSFTSRANRLIYMRLFFRWLVKTGQLKVNPAADIELPRRPFHLPRQVFSIAEIEQIFDRMNVRFKMAVRDRAMMEVLYATGIRRSELCHLKLADLNPDDGVLLVEQGKNNKDRMVPLGERAVYWLERYLNEKRRFIPGADQEPWLFLTYAGRPLRPRYLTSMLQKHIQRSGVEKSGCCHIFRHTMATQMLEGGADIRYIQEMLGHAKLATTQVYTRVSIGKLKEIHEKTHPAAFLKRRQEKVADDESLPGEKHAG